MITNSRLYKTISQDEFSHLNFKIKREYAYLTDSDVKPINEQSFENISNKKVFQLVDDDYEWNPKEQSLFLSVTISFDNISSLFGLNGAAYEDSILGVGLVWKPEKSRIKRCKKLCELDAKNNKISMTVKDIELPNISSNVDFYLVIYISKAGTSNGRSFVANENGMILYQELLWTIIIEGNGSIFPVYEVEKENGPIWSYYCDFSDIAEDAFDMEHIRIEINKKHPSYNMIHPKSPTYSQAYVNEILSTAVAMIILDIRSKQVDYKIDLNEECDQGTILNVLKYFSDKLAFKINDNYNSLVESIKIFFDKEI